MALSLPSVSTMKTPRHRPLDLAPARREIEISPSVALWRPGVVLATSITVPPSRPPVALAEPAARPEALAPHLDTAQSLLAALAEAQQTLGAAAAGARRRAEQAVSTRARVSATIAAHRAEAALDDVLSGAWKRLSALMKERGLR